MELSNESSNESSVDGAAIPILDSQLKPPRVSRNTLHRPRFTELLAAVDNPVLVGFNAPPGSGKTELLSQIYWEQHTKIRRPHAWLTVTSNENNLQRFLGAFSLSLRRTYPDLGERLQFLLLAGGECPPQLAMAVFCNELFQYNQPVNIIMDCCEYLQDSNIWQFVELLLENAPSDFQLICASRNKLPISIKALKSKRWISIGFDELRFTLSETRDLLKTVYQLDVDENYIHELYECSLGWPYALSLVPGKKSTKKWQTIESIKQELNEFYDAFCQQLSEQTLKILYCCSLLNTYFEQQLCELLEVDQKLIAEFQDQQIFSTCFEEKKSRLQPLFKTYLQSRFEEASASEVERLHRKAEAWYQKNKDVREAVYHGLFVSDSDGILLNLEEVAVELILRSELNTLQDWVNQLKGLGVKFSQHHEAVLQLAELWALTFSFKAKQVDEGLKSLQRRLDDEEIFLTDSAYATLQTITALNSAYNEKFADAAVIAKNTLNSGLELSHWSQGVLQNIMTYCAVQEMDFEAASAYQQQLAQHIDDKNIFVKTYNDVLTGNVLLLRGRFSEAEQYLKHGYELAENFVGNDVIASAIAAGYLAEYFYESNQLDQIEQIISFRLDVIDLGGLITAAIRAYLSYAKSQIHSGNFVRAQEILSRGKRVAQDRGWHRMTAACLYGYVVAAVKEKKQMVASQYLQELEAMLNVEENEPVVNQEINTYYLLAMAYFAQIAKIDVSFETDFQQKTELMESKGALLDAARMRVGWAMVLLSMGNTKKARDILLPALNYCVEGGFSRVIMDGGESVLALAEECAKSVKALNPLTALLNSHTADNATALAAMAKPEEEGAAKLSSKELEILMLLSSGLSNKDISEALEISIGTVKWHLSNIYHKMDVSSRTEAVFEAKVSGLVK